MALINYNYGNLLPEWEGAETTEARIEGLQAYLARRFPDRAMSNENEALDAGDSHYSSGLRKFIKDLEAYDASFETHEGGDASIMDAEKFYQGVVLLAGITNEKLNIARATNYYEMLHSEEEAQAFGEAITRTVEIIDAEGKACGAIIGKLNDADRLDGWSEEIEGIVPRIVESIQFFPELLEELNRQSDKVADAAPPLEAPYQLYANHLAAFSGGDVLKETLFGFDGADPEAAAALEECFTGSMRYVRQLLDKHGAENYIDYLEKTRGIPSEISSELYSFSKGLEQVLSFAGDDPVIEQTPEAARASLQDVVDAFTAFNPELGKRIQGMIDQGVFQVVGKDNHNNAYQSGFTLIDQLPYTEWTGNRTFISINGDEQDQTLDIFAHETSHGLHYEAMKARHNGDGYLSDIPHYTAELIAHIGEIIMLDHVLQNQTDGKDAMRLAVSLLSSNARLILRQTADGRAQNALLGNIPEDPEANIPLGEIENAYITSSYTMLEDANKLYHYATGPTLEGSYGYNMVDKQAYLYAVVGANAFAAKYFEADEAERKAMGKKWLDVIDHVEDHNWGSILEAVGVDVHAPDFLDNALNQFPRDLINQINERYGMEFDPDDAIKPAPQGQKIFTAALEAEREESQTSERNR